MTFSGCFDRDVELDATGEFDAVVLETVERHDASCARDVPGATRSDVAAAAMQQSVLFRV